MREFGDFQTPIGLADMVLRALYRRGKTWRRVLEPTCGTGSFIRALMSLEIPPHEICGLEVQPEHVDQASAATENKSERVCVRIKHADIFKMNLAECEWAERGPLLVVGNPPWVTNAELGSLNSTNLPKKSNLKGLRGFDAQTGESNFDIAEYIWIKLIKELAWATPTIALLCKTQVARNVLKFASVNNLPISQAEIYLIDAKKWFDAAVDACLFRVDVGFAATNYSASVFSDLNQVEPHSVLSLANGSLVSDTRAYERLSFIDGESPFEWRQGVKHDLAAVMELKEHSGILRNKHDELIRVEDEFVFPLLKSSDVHSPDAAAPRYNVIIPQKQLGDDTAKLEHSAPQLWAYLNKHLSEFNSRKSSIYEGRPPFAIFGIGEYSFSSYKVAVSGLYKNIHFRMVEPYNGKPVMLDDTCYFIPCDSLQRACVLSELLNDSESLTFINSVVFKDSKRPVTKKVLQRVDLRALLSHVDKSALLRRVNARLALFGMQAFSESVDWSQFISVVPEQQAQMTLS